MLNKYYHKAEKCQGTNVPFHKILAAEMEDDALFVLKMESGILWACIVEWKEERESGNKVIMCTGSTPERNVGMMTLYHGSNTANIKILEPNQADHDRPYVYMTTIDVVAAFYLCNAVERPYYWFPYGFESGSEIPVYHELYPNALKEVSEGVSGYLYEVIAEEDQVIPFKNIPCARLATEPIEVSSCVRVENAYDLFMEYVKQGKLKIGRFEEKSQ